MAILAEVVGGRANHWSRPRADYDFAHRYFRKRSISDGAHGQALSKFAQQIILFVRPAFRVSQWARWTACILRDRSVAATLSLHFYESAAMVRLAGLPARLGSVGPRLAAAPKVADRFYQSREWLALVGARKLDPDYHAAKARRKYPTERLILDHVIEIKDGGPRLDPKNTQWLTHSEHQAKTARAKAARASGGTRRGGGRKSGA